MQHNNINRLWGIPEDVDKQTRRLSGLLSLFCKDLGVDYIPLGNMAKVSNLDGVHYPLNEQEKIATIMSEKIKEIL
jgi:hypothetical protein